MVDRPRFPVSDKYPTHVWQRECLAAINEIDPVELKDKIDAAEFAMFHRAVELHTLDQDGEAEFAVMKEAAASLLRLKVVVLGYPDHTKQLGEL